MNNTSISNQVIVVTGAANGICRQVALDFDKKSNILCLFDKSDNLSKVASEFSKAEVYIQLGDVSDENQVTKFVDDVYEKYKRIDVLVNGAAVVPYQKLEDTTYELYKNTLETNLGGYFLFSKAVANVMKKQESGAIINIASISAYIGIAGQSAYASTKGGIVALTHVLASELGKFQIRVNAIAPGSIVVDRNREGMLRKWSDKADVDRHISLGRLGTPSDVSGVVQFLASDLSKYVTGETITVDGGQTTKGA